MDAFVGLFIPGLFSDSYKGLAFFLFYRKVSLLLPVSCCGSFYGNISKRNYYK